MYVAKARVDLAKTDALAIIISDVLISEVRDVFVRLYGREAGKYVRFYVESLPRRRKINASKIAREGRKHASFARDEDLNHLTAAKIGQADYFITTNSDFVESGAKAVVKMLTPKKFIELVGIEPYDTLMKKKGVRSILPEVEDTLEHHFPYSQVP